MSLIDVGIHDFPEIPFIYSLLNTMHSWEIQWCGITLLSTRFGIQNFPASRLDTTQG